MTAYRDLEERFAKVSRLEDALGILSWDKETTMPLGSAARRGEVIATLAVLSHEVLTDPRTGDLLAEASQEVDLLDSWQTANLGEMRRRHLHATAVPAPLVEQATLAATECEVRWRRARADDDFAGLLPFLQRVLDTQREIGAAKGEAMGLAPYDALIDQYDPGTTRALIDPIFATVGTALPELIGQAREIQARRPDMAAPSGPFPIQAQRVLGERLMQAIGFDFSRGRLDVSTHPFCGGATDDVRITTRYDEATFSSALMGILHETGHALYEQGLPAAWSAQPVGKARGMSLHESQSLLIEMQVCRGDAFLSFLAPLLGTLCGAVPSVAGLAQALRRVEPGLIRVDADEVTYPAHVMLRYRLEAAMIDGSLPLRDLPGAFRDGLHASIGVVVPDDRLGCLQDVHWPAGLFGYFPTYSLGAIIAAQLYGAANRNLPLLENDIAQGDFSRLVAWLRSAVHERASSESTACIVEGASGGPLDPQLYLRHLRARYATA